MVQGGAGSVMDLRLSIFKVCLGARCSSTSLGGLPLSMPPGPPDTLTFASLSVPFSMSMRFSSQVKARAGIGPAGRADLRSSVLASHLELLGHVRGPGGDGDLVAAGGQTAGRDVEHQGRTPLQPPWLEAALLPDRFLGLLVPHGGMEDLEI